MVIFNLAKTRFKDAELSNRPLEPRLKNMTITSYYFTYSMGPDIISVLEDDQYIIFYGKKTVKRFKKADILYFDYEFEDDVIIDDFIK